MKTEKKILRYEGLGFPVNLIGFPTKKIDDAEVPDYNMNDLMRLAFEALIIKKSRLTGAELKFVRNYLGETQAELARNVNAQHHSSVCGWEKKWSMPTGMDTNTEVVLRLYMLLHTKSKLKKIYDATWMKLNGIIFDALASLNGEPEALSLEYKEAA